MAKVERKQVDKSSVKGIPVVWIMGGPGSGKGTQCERIAMKYGYTHLSSGDLLRAEVMSGSNRGTQLYKLMANGEAVPNEIVDDIIAETMVKKKDSKGFLIDGFPLSEDQAAAFVADICEPTAVLAFEANDEVLKERLLSRNNFDDNEESISKRLKTYNEKTKAVMAKYNAKTINAERPANEIFEDVAKIMDEIK